MNHYLEVLEGNTAYEGLVDQAKTIDEKLKEWEQELIQPKQKTFQDVINFHNKLNAEWMYLKEFVDAEDPVVTLGAIERYKDLATQWKTQSKALDQIIEEDFRAFEAAFQEAKVPALIYPALGN